MRTQEKLGDPVEERRPAHLAESTRSGLRGIHSIIFRALDIAICLVCFPLFAAWLVLLRLVSAGRPFRPTFREGKHILFLVSEDFESQQEGGIVWHLLDRDEGGFFSRVIHVAYPMRGERTIEVGPGSLFHEWPRRFGR